MEVQGCDEDACDLLCGECEWEQCEVVASCGAERYDVRIDGELCHSVHSRFLRACCSTEKRRRT